MSLMAMNLHPNKDVQLHMVKTLQGHEVDEYLLTPDGNVTSRLVFTVYSSAINKDHFRDS